MRTTRKKFNLILALALWLVAAQMATAGTTTETRTMTWSMNGTGTSGSELTNSAGNRLVLSKNNWKGNSTLGNRSYTSILTENYGLVGTEIIFPDIVGKVTSVELKNVLFAYGGMCLKAGKDNSTLLCSTAFSSYDDENLTTYTSVFTFNGSLDVTASMPLKLMFMTAPGHSAPEGQCFKFRNGSITVTYEAEVEVPDPEDPGHNFSFNVSGNTLTATCNQQSQYHNCGLTDGKATLTLSVEDCTSNGGFTYNPASINLAEFNQQTGLQATKGDIVYTNNTTGQTTTVTMQVLDAGSYTASVTVIIGGNNYTLTKDFTILDGYKVNNNYSQFSVSKTSALKDDEITITYTQQMDEILEGLTLTGATSGNNIAYTQSGNTYTFTMPAEDVNLSATITYPLNENDFAQSGDTYTIKTAEGWNYFCQRMEVDDDLDGFSGKTVVLGDDISVTTMAGSGKYPFKGTFDGDGHTLTFNYTADMPNCAPFCTTNGATIRNLHATGQIDGGIWNYMGGLVGSASGKLTIENCRVSTQISSIISGTAFNGGFVGYLSSQYNQCHITGCVFDGLICNPNTWNQTYGCGGFVGAMSQYAYVDLTDCLFLHGQYDNNGNKCELYWGYDNDRNSTFFHRSNGYGGGTLTNCFYVGTRGLKQGSPAVESADAPDNFAHFGTPTDHGFLKVYGHTMVFDGKYYMPTYGDLVEHYDYSGVKSYIIEYDDAPLGIPDITSPLWTECLRYNRSFIAGKPVTIMLPFNFTRDRITLAHDNANPSGKFYEFKGIDNSGNPIMDEGNEVMENTLQANHPYLYVPGESTEYWDTYVSSGINIFTQDNGGGNKVAAYDNLKLVGTYNIKTWDAPEVGTFILNDNGELELVNDGTMVKPTSAYVTERRFLELANSADNCDAIELAAQSGGVYEAVKLTGRTLYKDGDWNTLTLPFALSAAEIAASPLAGATIMTLDGTTSNLDGEGLLTLNFETAYDPNDAPSGSIEAGVPYIVKWAPQADLFINSTQDWNAFCEQVNNGTESYSGKTVRLTSNISVTKMAGTHSNPFCGTFEGDGYTIEVTLDNNGDTGTNDESYGVAPFRFTSGATIRNLHVGGTITTSTRKYAGGIVGKTVSGTNNIQNCWVSAEIYSTINGDGTHGGFVGKVSGTVNITNCLFDGVLTTDKVNITHSCGGFVGWRDGNGALSIDHSMYAPAKLPDGKYTISSNNTCTLTRNNSSSYNADNCLYTQALGTAQGTNASTMSNDDKLDKLGSGWKISNGHVVPKMEVEQMPNIVNPVFSNVTVEDPASTVVSFNGGEFVGNFAPLEITDANRKSIVLLAAGNKLGYAKTDRTIANGKALGACRAYFHIPSISGNAQTARSFVLNFGEENVTTGIIEVNTNTTNKSEGAFNLQGRRIVNPKKGLYIVNGKKMIIK